MTPFALSVLFGAGMGAGLFLLVRELFPSGPALGPAMERLHGTVAAPRSHNTDDEPPVLARAGDAVAARVRHWPGITIPVRNLKLVGESVGELFGAKLLHFAVGLLLPSLFTLIVAIAGVHLPIGLSGLVGLLAGAGMWFLPDAQLAKRAARARAEATQAVMAYAELAAMERVSSAGAQDTLERPAEVGSGWVFQRIQAALLRARLDHAPAWEALRQISDELDVPAAADIADIVSSAGTDGAAIYATLRSRAESLADEQAANDQARANAASESLVVPVTLLSMVLLVFFGFPAVARIFSA
ncbi:type II secretion system F family protein [Streptomyces rhizosphaericus]|uniref:type II secretion system F family protein n=1 Tax=Streptomyces rhizosphaericus TaxID=114699 RepID=UPI000A3C346F|nr:type II secretion system F family protein [Streptomyces rhizosphaericus]